MRYKRGDVVMLLSTIDPHTLERPGDQGIVSSVDGLGTVHINWPNGSRLGLVPGEDEFMLVAEAPPYSDTPMTPYQEL